MQITRTGTWGYDMEDLQDGSESEIICNPGNAIIVTKGELVVGTYDKSAHADNMKMIFGDKVLHIPEWTTVEFTFPIPVWRFVVYISADTIDLERKSEIVCFWHDEYVAGDASRTTFGPCPDGPLPNGVRDFQYLVANRSPDAFPGYEPTPMDRAILDPKGAGVYIGTQFAKLDP